MHAESASHFREHRTPGDMTPTLLNLQGRSSMQCRGAHKGMHGQTMTHYRDQEEGRQDDKADLGVGWGAARRPGW